MNKLLNKYLVLGFLTCICFACKDDQQSLSTCKTININFDEKYDFAPASEIIDTTQVDIIQLAQTPEPIGKIVGIRVYKNQFYILGQGRHTISVFDDKGAYMRSINKVGKAANEYIEISDFFVANNQVYVMDNNIKKILIYDLQGNFSRMIDFKPIWGNWIFTWKDDIYLVNDGGDTSLGMNHLFKIDSNNDITPYIPFDKVPGLRCNEPYAFNSNECYYVSRADNLIYKITDDGVTPCYRIDFGKYAMPEDYYEKDARDLMKVKAYDKYAAGIEWFDASDNYLFFNFECIEPYTIVYDIKQEKVKISCRGLWEDKIFQLGLGSFFINNGYIYDVFYADQLMLRKKFGDISNLKEEYRVRLQALFDSITAEDNPIIFKFKLKE